MLLDADNIIEENNSFLSIANFLAFKTNFNIQF